MKRVTFVTPCGREFAHTVADAWAASVRRDWEESQIGKSRGITIIHNPETAVDVLISLKHIAVLRVEEAKA